MNVENSKNKPHQIFLEDTPPWGVSVYSLGEGVGLLNTLVDNPKIIEFLTENPPSHIDSPTLQVVYLRKTHSDESRTHSLGILGRWVKDRDTRLVYMRHHYVKYEPPLTKPLPPPPLWVGIFTENTWIPSFHKAREFWISKGMAKGQKRPIPPIMAMNPKDSTIYIALRHGQPILRRPGHLGAITEEVERLAKTILFELRIALSD